MEPGKLRRLFATAPIFQAPTGCSQYYNSNSGNISINLPDREYIGRPSLDICLARDPTACAIKYKMKTMGVGPTKVED